jgi:hypothetical protein
MSSTLFSASLVVIILAATPWDLRMEPLSQSIRRAMAAPANRPLPAVPLRRLYQAAAPSIEDRERDRYYSAAPTDGCRRG